MSFSLKPDFETVQKRYDAFWEREIVDRAPVCFSFRNKEPIEAPEKTYQSYRERWTDVDYRAEQMAASLQNRTYYADALPVAWPNMGPEIFSAWCGCGYEFGKSTTWSVPCIEDWERDYDKATLNMEHELFKLTDRFTDRLLELGKGNFIVGLTDFHPGGDHLAALRDPQNLAIDMIENVDWVKRKLADSTEEYMRAYNYFYEKLRAAGMPITSWTTFIHNGRYYIPSNDFSCMISAEMYRDVFLPRMIDECRFYDRSIYHLDGPGALRHLDTLLEIKELNAIQWVPGAGSEGFTRWLDVYKRIQAGGKGMQINGMTLSELPLMFEHLKPEGVFLSGVAGVEDIETADAVIKRIAAWK
jgi:hypothetical protein